MTLNGRNGRARQAIVGSTTPLCAAALNDVLKGAGFIVDTPFHDSGAALPILLSQTPDIAVLDFTGTTPSGVDMLREARAAGIRTRVVLLCNESDNDAPIDAVELSVDGLLLRTANLDAVRHCITTVADGEQWLDPRAMKAAYDRMAQRQAAVPSLLTRRERDVARLVAAGQRNRVIAGELGISEGTVKMHLHNVYAKMGLESRTQLAMDVRLRDGN